MKKSVRKLMFIVGVLILVLLVITYLDSHTKDERVVNKHFKEWDINLNVKEADVIKVDKNRWLGEYSDYITFSRTEAMDVTNNIYIKDLKSRISRQGGVNDVGIVSSMDATLASLLKSAELEFWEFEEGSRTLIIVVLDDLLVYVFTSN